MTALVLPFALRTALAPVLAVILLIALCAGSARALILVSEGDDPVENLGWPEGSEAVANLPGRLGFWEGPPFGGGQYVFEFPPQDAPAVQHALEAFSRVRSSTLEVHLIPGRATSTFLEEPGDGMSKAAVGFSFTVWRRESWDRLFNNPNSTFASDQPGYGQPVPAPRLTIHLDPAGPLDPDRLTIPGNITVIDRRLATADLPDAFKAAWKAAVGGSVVDASTGSPVAGARVTIIPGNAGEDSAPAHPDTHSADDGSFLLGFAAPRNAHVVVTADGYAPFVSREFFELADGRFFAGNRFALVPLATLRGRVVTRDGRPVGGVEIRGASMLGPDRLGYPQPTAPSATTADDGTFALDGLPKGWTSLRLAGGAWHPVDPLRVHPVPGDAPAEIVVVPTGTVEGTVKPPFPGSGDNAWHVSIEPEEGAGIGKWSGSARCGPDGGFRFENVPAGAYHVKVVSPTPPEPRNPLLVTVEGGKTASVVLEP